MNKTLDEVMLELSPEDRAEVEARARELIAEEMSLRELRKARDWTQTRLAQELGIHQESVSRLERRTDLLLSTLGNYIEAMGGELKLIAEFPDRPPCGWKGCCINMQQMRQCNKLLP